MTFRQKHGFEMAVGAVLLCAVALIGVWIPSEQEKDSFRTNIVNEPAMGRWISDPADLTAARDEILAINNRVAAVGKGEYTAEAYVADMLAIARIEKSLLPIEGGFEIRGTSRPFASRIDNTMIAPRALMIYRDLQVQIRFVDNNVMNAFHEKKRGWQEAEKVKDLAVQTGLSMITSRPVTYTDWHAGPLLAWIIQSYLQSMIVAILCFLVRAEIIGQRRMILLADAPRAAFWMLFWFAGIWRYPTREPLDFVRVVRRNLALAVSFMFTIAVPNFALAQSAKQDGKKKQEGHTLILSPAADVPLAGPPSPRNSFSFGVEAVDKYHGMAVGEIFAYDPGFRLMGRYTRSTDHGNIYVDSWNSVGEGSNTEADLGVGFERNGFDLSFTRLFVRGGDLGAVAVAKSGTAKIGKAKTPISVQLSHFFGTNPSSPPGGTVLKVGTGFGYKLGSKLNLQHRFALGVDNNPFGLGKGLSAVGFYTAEVSYKRAYGSWTATLPVAGRDNTTRKLRQSFSVGLRHSYAW